jgi:UDPglucose 6-dehydrogenase
MNAATLFTSCQARRLNEFLTTFTYLLAMSGLVSLAPRKTKLSRRVATIGAGHVGLVTAACFAELGHTVVCMDIDAYRIAEINRGCLPFHEPELDALINKHRGNGLTFTSGYEEALSGAEFVFLAVATPTTAFGSPDLQYVRAAARAVARVCGDQRPILVSKSTAPVGISETLESILAAEANGHGPLEVVANPEFLREGTAVRDFLWPDRVVIGSASEEASAEVASLYEPLECPIILTEIKTAEMVKYASNAFLATKISFINEIAEICEKVGADVRQVALGMGMDPRIGREFLSAGIGFGGSCLPKDVRALAHLAAVFGSHPQLLNTVLEINSEQRRRLVTRLRSVLGGLRGARVAILGLSFKPGTDDVRESPAFDLIRLLEYEEATVVGCDPFAIEATREVFPHAAYELDPYAAATGCDAVILATDWPAFKQLDLVALKAVMRTPVLADGRNGWEPAEARELGFVHFGMGLPEDTGLPPRLRLQEVAV